MKDLKRLIFIELNELNFEYANEYIKKYNLKNFKKLYDIGISETFSEKEYDYLEPWIQWTSVHSGLSAKDHKIFRLGDIVKSNLKDIFREVEKKGYKVGALMPMNTKNNLVSPAYFIPDAWTLTHTDKSYWSKLLYKSLSQVILDNSKRKIKFTSFLSLLICFFKFFQFKNIFLYLKFFLKGINKKFFFVLFLDLFLHDIHIKLLKKHKANFSTIFFNGVAHIQHHYLFNAYLLNNEIKNPEWYMSKKNDPFFEILKLYDNIIGDYLKFKDYNLMIATGLSQEKYDRVKYYYRLKNHRNFLDKLEIKYKNLHPRMTRDFLIEFDNKANALYGQEILDQLLIDNKIKMFNLIENRGNSLFVTLTYPNEVKENQKIFLKGKEVLNFSDQIVFVALKNGMHSSKGFLYKSFSPKEDKIEVRKIYSILNNFFDN